MANVFWGDSEGVTGGRKILCEIKNTTSKKKTGKSWEAVLFFEAKNSRILRFLSRPCCPHFGTDRFFFFVSLKGNIPNLGIENMTCESVLLGQSSRNNVPKWPNQFFE